ncbi:tRNA-(Ms[2]io[6]A)-hydroxylase [Sulfidibacter corallicola]|uniref:tRNA-(ms[2]io[6]A)-hydroxylase n=1 Tax=Sulfidibacter corallicola TaxID=2818388 RepID=UPI001F3F428B|nr:tRNA isopentenyl-2-thiomethyl-A-37 hydroxylase MiaE [Sulfidibacter corallicola]
MTPTTTAKSRTAVPDLHQFLRCTTPDAWIAAALERQDILLVDHANCEKKAASTALNLMFRYVDRGDLLQKMSRLAREELRHFEQVLAIMKARNIDYVHVTASRYAEGLRKHMRKQDPQRLVDVLIIGAYIEARSCERFEKLAPHLDEELERFYTSLLRSEARHFADYLKLARQYADGCIQDRIDFFGAVEAELIESPDPTFRFHSGTPA